MELSAWFTRLFEALSQSGYAWTPVSPDQLAKFRKEPDSFPALTRFFALGLDVTDDELEAEGFPVELAKPAREMGLAISRVGEFFIPHHHWHGSDEKKRSSDYVYLGRESSRLLEKIQSHPECFQGARVLDLGSGAGVLSFGVAHLAREILGIELSPTAVQWASAAALAQGLEKRMRFAQARIGAFELAAAEWDRAIFNPPLAVPDGDFKQEYRDGGRLGIEIPLQFLEFAHSKLVTGGEAWCLLTSPIVRGKSPLWESKQMRAWKVIEQQRLDEHFNQSLARKHRYAELGIERIELWWLRLKNDPR